jgi:hypothetical protein
LPPSSLTWGAIAQIIDNELGLLAYKPQDQYFKKRRAPAERIDNQINTCGYPDLATHSKVSGNPPPAVLIKIDHSEA